MNHIRTFLGQHTSRWAVAVAATLGLVAGGAWYSVAAGTKASQAVIAQPAPTRLHVAASGRDSYADVVKAVAPAVVTPSWAPSTG